MKSEIDPDGSLPDVVPAERFARRPGDPSWTAAFIETAYQLLKVDGMRSLVAQYWPQIQMHLSQLAAAAKASPTAWPTTTYGDWVPPSQPPGASHQCNPTNNPPGTCHFPLARAYTSAYAWISNLQASATIAAAIGEHAAATELRSLIAQLARRWNGEWLHVQNGTYDTGIQTTFALPLALGIVPNSSHSIVAESFTKSVQAAKLHGTGKHTQHTLVTEQCRERLRWEVTEPNCAALNSLWNGYNCIGTVGIIGAKALFPALAAIDRRDLALAILEKTDYPSFGYMRYNTLEPATSNLW
jgi:alpha-L-rhamnosidase